METATTEKAILELAVGFWKDQGRKEEDIMTVLMSNDEDLIKEVLKPAVKIYKMLKEEFAGE